MTEEDFKQQVQRREQAQRDLEHIQKLEQSDPFQQYFRRRVGQKAAEIDAKFRDDPPSVCDATQREAYRQQLVLLDWVMNKMMSSDKGSAINELKQPFPGR